MGMIELPSTIGNFGCRNRLTITMENKNGGDVSTVHVRAANAPPSVSGNTSPGRMKDGQKSVFVVKAGWSGNIAVSNAQ